MKKLSLTFGLIALLGLSTVSCSTDDSALTDTSAENMVADKLGNGDIGLPRPTTPKP